MLAGSPIACFSAEKPRAESRAEKLREMTGEGADSRIWPGLEARIGCPRNGSAGKESCLGF